MIPKIIQKGGGGYPVILGVRCAGHLTPLASPNNLFSSKPTALTSE